MGKVNKVLIKKSIRVLVVVVGGISLVAGIMNADPDVSRNFTLDGITSVSSVHQGAPQLDATKLKDGLYGTNNSWVGAMYEATWWAKVALDSTRPVSAVAFSGETQGRTPKDFTIEVSTDDINYTVWKKVTGRSDPGRIVYAGYEPVVARYVKIVITDINGTREAGYSAGIEEIEIFDDAAMANPPRSSTIVIAASNSLTKSKAQVDYVCDGTDDNVEIQAAIDKLPATSGNIGGGTIQLLEGTFTLGAKLNFGDKVVNLIGVGRYSTRLIFKSGVNDDMILVGTGITAGLPAGRIALMTLEGASGLQTSGSGIRVQATNNLVIEDVRIYDFKENGINVQGVGMRPGNMVIKGCRIEYNKKNGIYLGQGSEGIIITSCSINDNGTSGQSFHGIYCDGTDEVGGSFIISGCQLWQNKWNQININKTPHIKIIGNTILSSPYENIKIYGGAHVITITGNSIHSASESGNNAAPHITLGESPTSIARDITISGNTFSSPTTGPQPSAILIENSGSYSNRFIGNVISDNVTKVVMTGADSTIYAEGNTGSFTFTNTNTTVVNNICVTGNSKIVLFPTNASAATMVSGAKSPYISAKTVGVSFTVATANGQAAAGTETFNYIIFD